jgi:sugar phosphate isomerase/epimerase
MSNISRKNFLRTASGLLVMPQIIKNISAKKPRLSFSTLGCPDWSLPEILKFAVIHHYQGVEIRGIQRELDLPVSKHFNSPSSIAETKKMFADSNQAIVDLGASSEMHFPESLQRQKQIDEAKRYIDLASNVGCPFIRVFPNKFLPERSHEETIELISKALNELGSYAKGSGVRVLMETHGDLVRSGDIQKIMANTSPDHTGLVWDVANMWSVTRETPADVYSRLKQYIFHAHIKDIKITHGKEELVLLGQGDLPIFDAIDILVHNNYPGYFSFEWEKLWHPEIEGPEVSFPQYAQAMQHHFSKKH